MVVDKAYDQVDVVRHDDETIEGVVLGIEMAEGRFDFGRARRIAENAGAVAGVEPLLKAGGEFVTVGEFGGGVPWRRVLPEPGGAFGVPGFEKRGRKGIGEAPSDKDEGTGLRPVGKVPSMDGDRRVGVEEGAVHRFVLGEGIKEDGPPGPSWELENGPGGPFSYMGTLP